MKSLVAFFSVLIVLPVLAFSQSRIDPAVKGKPVSGAHILRINPKQGEIFHYKTSLKSQVSIKNSDDLLKDIMPNLKANEKALYTIGYYLTAAVRTIREDGATDFLFRIDSIHSSLENDIGKRNYTSTDTVDKYDSSFFYDAVYTGSDFGVIVDPTGNIRDVYGIYNTIDLLYYDNDDSLQTDEEFSNLTNTVYKRVSSVARTVFDFMRSDTVELNSKSETSTKENHQVWSTIEFPMIKEYRDTMIGFEERAGKTYAVFNTQTTLTPSERVLDEEEYSTTLPNYSYLYKGTEYVDISNGMLAYNKWTEEKSYAMKIDSKLAEKAGKSFATVQRSKLETVVELMK